MRDQGQLIEPGQLLAKIGRRLEGVTGRSTGSTKARQVAIRLHRQEAKPAAALQFAARAILRDAQDKKVRLSLRWRLRYQRQDDNSQPADRQG